jgi:undecaprenyl diphosphate synthase
MTLLGDITKVDRDTLILKFIDILFNIVKSDDWRLTGQESYLLFTKVKKILPKEYINNLEKPELFHEHCSFCWDKVEENKDEMISTLQDVLRIRSVVEPAKGNMPFGQGVHEAFEYMMNKCRDEGFVVKNVDNYGGHAEILRAAQSLAQKVAAGEFAVGEITKEMFEDELYTHDLPPVDLLIRTSGEKRTSNFLPWQTAYAEMVFDNTLWPDYDRACYLKNLREYASRDRRFGGVKTPTQTEVEN